MMGQAMSLRWFEECDSGFLEAAHKGEIGQVPSEKQYLRTHHELSVLSLPLLLIAASVHRWGN